MILAKENPKKDFKYEQLKWNFPMKEKSFRHVHYYHFYLLTMPTHKIYRFYCVIFSKLVLDESYLKVKITPTIAYNFQCEAFDTSPNACGSGLVCVKNCDAPNWLAQIQNPQECVMSHNWYFEGYTKALVLLGYDIYSIVQMYIELSHFKPLRNKFNMYMKLQQRERQRVSQKYIIIDFIDHYRDLFVRKSRANTMHARIQLDNYLILRVFYIVLLLMYELYWTTVGTTSRGLLIFMKPPPIANDRELANNFFRFIKI